MTTLQTPNGVDLITDTGVLGVYANHLNENIIKMNIKPPTVKPMSLLNSNIKPEFATPSRETTFSPDPFIKSSSSSMLKESPMTAGAVKNVSIFDILLAMMDKVAGKDKMAKIGQYLLRLVLYYTTKTSRYLSTEDFNIKILEANYNTNIAKSNLLLNFVRHPQKFMKIVILLLTSILERKLTGVVSGLSMYRQFMRFGKTPFRLLKLGSKIRNTVSLDKPLDYEKIQAHWFNSGALGDIFNLYYGVMDESGLLYKLGFLSNKNYKVFASRHESIAWYLSIILDLNNKYNDLQNLKAREFEIKIEKQIKMRARKLTKQLVNSIPENSSPIRGKLNFEQWSHSGSKETDLEELPEVKDLKHKQYLVKLDLYRLICDFTFDSFDVWHIKKPFDTAQILLGVGSAGFALTKIYDDTKRELCK